MAEPNTEFTSLNSLRAEAIGEPGQRTFRILADSAGASAIIWLEKEQLFQLALAINQLLATLPESSAGADVSSEERRASPSADIEFKAGHIVLGHDGSTGRFMIDAHDVEDGEDEPPTIRVWGGRALVSAFADESLLACAAGRPICPLCGSPIDSTGHRCPRSNGHGLLDLKDL